MKSNIHLGARDCGAAAFRNQRPEELRNFSSLGDVTLAYGGLIYSARKGIAHEKEKYDKAGIASGSAAGGYSRFGRFASDPNLKERYLHVRVNNPTTHELVRVNVPLSLAEKVIPAVNHGKLRDGKVQIGGLPVKDVDLKAILGALKSAPEGEFVTVQEPDSDVHVAKEHGHLIVHVVDKKSNEKVDVSIPWDVAEALASDTTEGQLNVEAAIRALENAADVTLVTVTSHDENVRVWVDSSNTGE